MPSHWSHPQFEYRLRFVADWFADFAGGGLLRRPAAILPAHPDTAKKASSDYREFKDVTFHGDEVTLATLGEGASSEGEFWEAMNTVSNKRLPLIFLVEDNEYAISVPVEAQMPGGNISRLVSGFPNFHFEEIDGTDLPASYAAFARTVAYCRAHEGPGFIHAHVIRPYSHSLSDDERQLSS